MARSLSSPRIASSNISPLPCPSYRLDISLEPIERIYRNDICQEGARQTRRRMNPPVGSQNGREFPGPAGGDSQTASRGQRGPLTFDLTVPPAGTGLAE